MREEARIKRLEDEEVSLLENSQQTVNVVNRRSREEKLTPRSKSFKMN
jgi:hypothetical protein